jgi:hypothetical protein
MDAPRREAAQIHDIWGIGHRQSRLADGGKSRPAASNSRSGRLASSKSVNDAIRRASWERLQSTAVWLNKIGGVGPMGKKEREDDSTKDFKKAVKATAKPSKKEKKKVDKITKHLSKNEKI